MDDASNELQIDGSAGDSGGTAETEHEDYVENLNRNVATMMVQNKEIIELLRSIKNGVTFFVVIAVISIVISACSALGL